MKQAVLVALTVLGALVACSGTKQVTTTPPPAPEPNQDSVAAVEQAARDSAKLAAERQAEAERLAQQRSADSAAQLARATEEARTVLTALIHFEYDESKILPEAAALLDQKVATLWTNSDASIRIGGHCDERGSDEYNLALGNRRATSAKEYLVSRGVAADRIETVSYGEERPIDGRRSKEAWAKNRRGEFEIVSGKLALTHP
jgi:peptidoglycan-associated lipoprotein